MKPNDPRGLLLGHQGEFIPNPSSWHRLDQGQLPFKGSRGAILVPSMSPAVVSSLPTSQTVGAERRILRHQQAIHFLARRGHSGHKRTTERTLRPQENNLGTVCSKVSLWQSCPSSAVLPATSHVLSASGARPCTKH